MITGSLFYLLLTSYHVIVSWTAAPESDISTYKIYIGQTSGVYSNVEDAGNVTERKLDYTFEPGRTYFIMATATNTAGLESDPSNELKLCAIKTVVVGNTLVTNTCGAGTYRLEATVDAVNWSVVDTKQITTETEVIFPFVIDPIMPRKFFKVTKVNE